MNEGLQKFTLDALDAWEAVRTEISPGVWKVDLPGGEGGHASWFLGRPTGDLLITFDLDRWEEGTRLECLTLASPLVRRLQQYAEARGCLATVTIDPPASPSGAADTAPRRFEPYLMARFSARLASDRVVEQHSWMGINRVTGRVVRVTGDTLNAPSLREGEPDPAERTEPAIDERNALEQLAAAWEQVMDHRQAEFEREARARYEDEAHEAASVLAGDDLQARFKVLADRYAMTVDTHIEAALRLWRVLK